MYLSSEFFNIIIIKANNFVSVLQKLHWELSTPTSLQFLSLLLSHLTSLMSRSVLDLVTRQVNTFLMLVATESSLLSTRPSVLACSAILISLEQVSGSIDQNIIKLLSELVRVKQVRLSYLNCFKNKIFCRTSCLEDCQNYEYL